MGKLLHLLHLIHLSGATAQRICNFTTFMLLFYYIAYTYKRKMGINNNISLSLSIYIPSKYSTQKLAFQDHG